MLHPGVIACVERGPPDLWSHSLSPVGLHSERKAKEREQKEQRTAFGRCRCEVTGGREPDRFQGQGSKAMLFVAMLWFA